MVQEKETLACISKVSIKSIVFIPRYHADNLFRVQHFVRSPRFDRYEIRLQHHDRKFCGALMENADSGNFQRDISE